MSYLGCVLRGLLAMAHRAGGMLAYRLGCRRAARRHFERVLLLRGADFAAYVQLGRLAFDAGDYASWRRELEHARRLDPERFARLRHRLDVSAPRLAGTRFLADPRFHDAPLGGAGNGAFDASGARAMWRTLRPAGGARPDSGKRADADAAGLEGTGLDALLPGADFSTQRYVGRLPVDPPEPELDARAAEGRCDDCSSAAERLRFQRLGPIAHAELQHCDLDDLLRRLSG